MCYYIDSDVIIANCLRNKNDCQINELHSIKSKLEKQIPNIYIDTTRTSIQNSVAYHSQIFMIIGDRIVRMPDSEKYFIEPIFSYFKNKIDPRIRLNFNSAISEMI